VEQKQLFAYMMEIYAGFLEQTDYNVGRVLEAIEQLGQLDNTLVIYIVGDNGASSEGLFQGTLNEVATMNRILEDFSEAVNLADKHPDKLHELQLMFYAEAARYVVLPLDHNRIPRFDVSIRPSLTRGRIEFTYHGGLTRIPEGAAPDVKNKSFRITANLVLPEGAEQGVVLTQGGLSAGYALLFKAGKPSFYYNVADVAHFDIAAKDAVPPGKHTVVCDFTYDGGGFGRGGTGILGVDGKQVARGRIDRTIAVRFSFDETFDVGEDTGTAVNDDYDVPCAFTGEIEKVVVKLGETGEKARQHAEARSRADE
jgi:arylsulfatase